MTKEHPRWGEDEGVAICASTRIRKLKAPRALIGWTRGVWRKNPARRPTINEAFAFTACAGETGIHTGNDHLALELTEHGEHPEHRTTGGSRRVQGLRVDVQAGSGIPDGLQDLNQVLK